MISLASKLLFAFVSALALIYRIRYVFPNFYKDYMRTRWNASIQNPRQEVCYDIVGCFDIGEPWTTFSRPVPPPQRPNENFAYLYFHNRNNSQSPYIVRTYPDFNVSNIPFDNKRPTIIMVHGYVGSAYEWYLRELKDAYLKKVDSNVFLTDWSRIAYRSYSQSVSNGRVVARLVARVMTYLIKERGLLRDTIHVIGHSAGAHIAAYIANELHGVSRLTAVEPAQPLYQSEDKAVRVDKTDADFVEVIHTDSSNFILFLGLGMNQPVGDVDFIINNGNSQPACVLPSFRMVPNVFRGGILYPLFNTLCNHFIALEYLTEAYSNTNCVFWGHTAINTESDSSTPPVSSIQATLIAPKYKMKTENCTKDNCIPFGFEAINSPLRGVFVVKTNARSPFCVPELGPEP